MPTLPSNTNPQPVRRRSLREQLRHTVNANAVELVGNGFDAIDALARRGAAELGRHGVKDVGELAETGAHELKKLLVRAISGKREA